MLFSRRIRILARLFSLKQTQYLQSSFFFQNAISLKLPSLYLSHYFSAFAISGFVLKVKYTHLIFIKLTEKLRPFCFTCCCDTVAGIPCETHQIPVLWTMPQSKHTNSFQWDNVWYFIVLDNIVNFLCAMEKVEIFKWWIRSQRNSYLPFSFISLRSFWLNSVAKCTGICEKIISIVWHWIHLKRTALEYCSSAKVFVAAEACNVIHVHSICWWWCFVYVFI